MNFILEKKKAILIDSFNWPLNNVKINLHVTYS